LPIVDQLPVRRSWTSTSGHRFEADIDIDIPRLKPRKIDDRWSTSRTDEVFAMNSTKPTSQELYATFNDPVSPLPDHRP